MTFQAKLYDFWNVSHIPKGKVTNKALTRYTWHTRLRNEDVFQAFQISALFSNALNDKFVFIQIWDNLYFHIFLLKPLCDLLFMPTTEVPVKHIAEEKNLMFFIQKTKCLRNFFFE